MSRALKHYQDFVARRAADQRLLRETGLAQFRKASELGVPLAAVVHVEHDPERGRALVLRCEATGCRAPLRLDATGVWGATAALAPGELELARAWLRRSTRPDGTREPASGAWWPWALAGGAAAVAAGVLLVVLSSDSDPAPAGLEIVIDPNEIRE